MGVEGGAERERGGQGRWAGLVYHLHMGVGDGSGKASVGGVVRGSGARATVVWVGAQSGY